MEATTFAPTPDAAAGRPAEASIATTITTKPANIWVLMGTSFAVPIDAIVRRVRACKRNPYAKLAPLLLGMAIFSASCGSLPTEEQVNRDLYGNFQTAVASDRNYDVYWMGRSFEAGGLTYKGPEANAAAGSDGLGAGIGLNDADHVAINYAPVCNTCVGIAITLYSRSAWDGRSARTPRPDLKFEAVQVNGHSAQLWTRLYSAGGDISAWIMVVDYGRTVVEAVASPFAPATPDASVGPVMDKATFLAAMQQLRPYPQ